MEMVHGSRQGSDPGGGSSPPHSTGCNCRKSRCLKLYCQCFASSSTCNPSRCKCVNCRNAPEFGDEIQRVREMILERNPKAFERKVYSEEGREDLLGCKCRTSNCLKKYCECYSASAKCGANCRCIDCKNRGDPTPSGPVNR